MNKLKIYTISALLLACSFSAATAKTGVHNRKALYNDVPMEVIDLHFHPSSGWDQLGPLGKQFIKKELPKWIPAALKEFSLRTVSKLINAPYSFMGIKNECLKAGISFCGLFATYAPQTWGVVDNEYIKNVLEDERNTENQFAQKMFFGLASVDINDWDTSKAEKLKYLESYLWHPSVKGIKMAHIHNNISLGKKGYEGIYDLAQKHNKPIYHHIGSTPIRTLNDFQTQQEKSNYLSSYDPNELEHLIRKYKDVNFVLGHMGFDFNKEGFDFTDDAMYLAETYDNVFLEVSAIGRPVFDKDGKFLDSIFSRLKDKNIINKVIYGSDGPVYPGATKAYLSSVLKSMNRSGYTFLEAQSILFHNANRIYDIY
jgi:predicted TIM-barrel fold metal-dependent hydrolase